MPDELSVAVRTCENRTARGGASFPPGGRRRWTHWVVPFSVQLSVIGEEAQRAALWNGDPSVWSGRAPLLFPIVGALAGGAYRLGPKTYHLSRHGFARGKLFETADA